MGDIGLSRGMTALEKARQVKPSLRETLLAMVQANEKAGRPDRALALHRELTLHIRKAQHENIVRHQELHLKQLESNEDKQFPPHLLEEKALNDGKNRRPNCRNKARAIARADGLHRRNARRSDRRALLSRGQAGGVACAGAWRIASDLRHDRVAARLHDIGKVGIPDTLMQKATLLSDGERQILETHAKTGAELLSRTKVSYGELAEDIARHHHERWDGHGYPDGIFGSAIPLAARIVAVCDVYDG